MAQSNSARQSQPAQIQTASLIGLALLTLLSVACSSENFSASSPAGSASQSSISDNGNGNTDGSGLLTVPVTTSFFDVMATFSTNSVVPLDIVWIIDNSGSMSDSATEVRNNFQDFITSVQGASNVNVLLVSKMGTTGEAVTLPGATSNPAAASPNGGSLIQINQTVASTDALDIIASGLCASGSANAVCKSAAVTKYTAIQGELVQFFRPNSKKVFVVVTDDQSSLSQADFLSAFGAAYAGQSPVVFGFVGLGAAKSSCEAREGTVYESLTAGTGGQAFNVCDPDWSGTFGQLASNINQLTSSNVALPSNILSKKIVAVALNGLPLSTSQYVITSTGVSINASVLKGLTSGTVRITYQN